MATIKELLEQHELPFCFIDNRYGDNSLFWATEATEEGLIVHDALGRVTVNGPWPVSDPYTDYDLWYLLKKPSDPSKKFIVLLGPSGRFWSDNSGYYSDWYEEIACVDTVREAQEKCGYYFPVAG